MNITPLEKLELDNFHLREKDEPRNRNSSVPPFCIFCLNDSLVEAHGRYHCTYCGQAISVCCDGETATN